MTESNPWSRLTCSAYKNLRGVKEWIRKYVKHCEEQQQQRAAKASPEKGHFTSFGSSPVRTLRLAGFFLPKSRTTVQLVLDNRQVFSTDLKCACSCTGPRLREVGYERFLRDPLALAKGAAGPRKTLAPTRATKPHPRAASPVRRPVLTLTIRCSREARALTAQCPRLLGRTRLLSTSSNSRCQLLGPNS